MNFKSYICNLKPECSEISVKGIEIMKTCKHIQN